MIRHLPLAGLALAIATTVAFDARAEAISGAIYTSRANGALVNGNLYESPDAVFLNGGPPANAPCSAGGMDDGWYVFQVTDPSGAQLLSQDGIEARRFRVQGGVVFEYDGPASRTTPGLCGGIAIALAPFSASPNGGGVYKVWVTRDADFAAACGLGVDCGLAGFRPGSTKTDNFRIAGPHEVDPTGNLEAFKFYDGNGNGLQDAGEAPLAAWPMRLAPDAANESALQSTNLAGLATWTGLAPGRYTVAEGEPELAAGALWQHARVVDGEVVRTLLDPADGIPVELDAEVIASGVARVAFGNYCEVGSGGRTIGFWSNRNGQALMADDGGDAAELALLRSLALRTPQGGHFDPANYAAFRSWLLAGSATNMANMLSVQLSALVLNIEAGLVDRDAYVLPYGGTVDQLVAAAEIALMDGLTVEAGPARSRQEALKDHIDALNNGALVIPVEPCARAFDAEGGTGG